MAGLFLGIGRLEPLTRDLATAKDHRSLGRVAIKAEKELAHFRE